MAFVKGKSGNPGGRPKQQFDIVALARSKSKANLERIARLAESAQDENVQLRASIALHEIAWGKPAQAVQATHDGVIEIVCRGMPMPSQPAFAGLRPP